jgi:hypothetical protein
LFFAFASNLKRTKFPLFKQTSFAVLQAALPPVVFLRFLARLEGLEPPAYSLEGCCSIRLSYRRLKNFYHFIDGLSIKRTVTGGTFLKAARPIPYGVGLSFLYILW